VLPVRFIAVTGPRLTWYKIPHPLPARNGGHVPRIVFPSTEQIWEGLRFEDTKI